MTWKPPPLGRGGCQFREFCFGLIRHILIDHSRREQAVDHLARSLDLLDEFIRSRILGLGSETPFGRAGITVTALQIRIPDVDPFLHVMPDQLLPAAVQTVTRPARASVRIISSGFDTLLRAIVTEKLPERLA